jgi:xanthine dehydrogenase accessory factor
MRLDPMPRPSCPTVNVPFARRWLAEGVPAIVVTVGTTRGSVPREQGTRMLVTTDAVAGTIGGGHLELQAIEQARQGLARARRDRWDWPVALGPSLGQCCGGALTLHFAPLDEAAVATWADPPPRFHLQLYGAGHVGRAVVNVLADVPCRVQWIDERESEFPLDDRLPAHVEKICVEPVEAEVRHAPPGAAYLVMTHRHDLDLAIVTAILKRGDFGFCGLIGSATKRARFDSRLRAAGLSEALLARMTCPIGIPGLQGKEPGVIAISVTAQLLISHIDSR